MISIAVPYFFMRDSKISDFSLNTCNGTTLGAPPSNNLMIHVYLIITVYDRNRMYPARAYKLFFCPPDNGNTGGN